MKIINILEITEPAGTYAAVKFDEATKDALLTYAKENKLPHVVKRDSLHCTLLYSHKHCPDYKAIGKIDPPMIATPDGFNVWESSENEDGTKTKCLVVKLNCPELVNRHKELMDEHGATFDYPTYTPHVTLSYDIGDIDTNDMTDIKKVVPTLTIIEEYGEDLKSDWASANSD